MGFSHSLDPHRTSAQKSDKRVPFKSLCMGPKFLFALLRSLIILWAHQHHDRGR
jgi:hypothetical protein